MTKRRSRGEGSIYFLRSKDLWVSKMTLPDGTYKVKYGKTQKAVRDWLVASQNALRQGLLAKDNSTTVAEFLANYMETVGKHTLRPKTIEVYSYLIRLHIVPVIGKLKLVQLRPDHLQSLYSQKLESGLSRRTVQFMHTIIHRSLDQAFQWGLVVRNVADLAQAPSPNRKPLKIFTPSEVHTFLNWVKEHRYYLIYLLAIYCGFREGEVLGIYVEDCDLEKGIIQVRHTVQSIAGQGLIITEPKTEKSRRSVTVPQTALAALKKHVNQLNKKHGLIFSTSSGKPISPRNILRHFKLL